MTEGTSTFLGLGVGLSGEYELKGVSETLDIFTLTGASSSSTGDLLVVQNSTGTEFLVIASSGALTLAGSYAGTISQPLAISGSVSFSAGLTSTISSTASLAGVTVSVTSTGALTSETSYLVNGIAVVASSKSAMNNVILYDSGAEGTVSTAVSFLAVKGTKAPDAFLKVGNSTFGLGAAADNGFFNASMTWTVFPTSAIAMSGIKVLAGTATLYIPAWPSTTFNA